MLFFRYVCRIRHSRELTCWKLLLLTGCLLLLNWLGNKGSLHTIPEAQFLNDRASDIIGAEPLQVPGLVVPAGLTGRGQILGLADSGLDRGNLNDLHPDLQSVPGQMPKVIMLKSWAGRKVPDDPVGHGTHMAATLVGTGAASAGQFQGIAPEASLYFQALLDQNSILKTPQSLRDLFSPAYSAGVRIHINGWGGGQNTYGDNTAQIDRFVRMYPDFLPVIAAGNSGPTVNSLTSEANSKNALVIGASQSVRPTLSPEAAEAGQVTKFSSQGPAGDGRIKPDLVAPGSALVSACSSLVNSNFAANPQYTMMEGSSMGAAVAGGATGLLRQWFQEEGVGEEEEEEVADPSAALLKSALINGAHREQVSTDFAQGFGVLDISNTVLALQSDSFLYADEPAGVIADEVAEYRFTVREKGAPFKATLAWTDPSVTAGSTATLVNNLDLQVIDPKGNQYWGNAWLNSSRSQPGSNSQADTLNNVEQVQIPAAEPGEYLVRVWGTEIKSPVAINDGEMQAQDYAVVYGQPVAEGIVDQVLSGRQVKMADGRVVDLNGKQIYQVVNGKKAASGTQLSSTKEGVAGAQLYQTDKAAYLVSRIWKAGAIQLLETDQGPLFMEISANQREGGYYYNPDSKQSILVNERRVDTLKDLPSGVEVSGTVNPVSQTLWQVAVGYIEKTGFIQKVDLEKQQIWLFQDAQPYQLDSELVISINDEIGDSGLLDSAFGGGDAAVSLEQLLSGMPVRLVLSPVDGQVQYLSVQRDLAIGRLSQVDPQTQRLRLEYGTEFNVASGTEIIRNQQVVSLSDLRPGDYLMAVIIPDTQDIVRIVAYTDVAFGQIIYWGTKTGTLYLVDQRNRFKIFKLTEQTQVYRWGIQVDPGILRQGQWVRLATQPGGELIWRMDVVHTIETKNATIAEYTPQTRVLEFTDGTSNPLDPDALITKQGYPIEPGDLVPGESAKVSYLKSQSSAHAVLAAVEAIETPGLADPQLQVAAMKQENVVRVKGNTSADRLFLYRKGGQRELIPVAGNGDFVWYIEITPGESMVQVVAMDSRKGGLSDHQIELSQVSRYGFTDIEGHWAVVPINDLARRGTLNGYEDGTFRPGELITRSEIACILDNLIIWSTDSAPAANQLGFTDAGQIPAWALNAVTVVRAQGLIQGYPDRTYKPQNLITRGELAVLTVRMLEKAGWKEQMKSGTQSPVNINLAQIPAWCRPAVKQNVELGIMNGREEGRFEPEQSATRAEVATVFYRMLEVLGNQGSW